MDIQHWKK